MTDTSQMTGYEGDEALQARLLSLGVTRTFAEVRAMMARDAWSLEPSTLEDTVLAIVAGADEGPLDLELVGQLRALKERLARHADPAGDLFTVVPATPSASAAELLQRLADRRAEASILMGIFTFSRHVHPQL